jgi:mannan endo-1,4-beta-mannosidase
MYASHADADNILNDAATNNFRVLRDWAFNDADSITGGPNGITLQYWNGTAPAYNDGVNGFQNMDYFIYKAGLLNLRLILVLTNNWSAFGGMDWYVKHAGFTKHSTFYTDPTIRTWFKGYINHVLNRVNSYTGVAYKNDPTIMAWQLANEPRCTAADCPNGTAVTAWASDISAYIKSIDTNHLVGTGSEGFYCNQGSDWTVNCNNGVDESAMARLSTIDFEGAHFYPNHWHKPDDWGTTYWIPLHISDANAAGKPLILDEFGSQRTKSTAYPAWANAMYNGGGDGWNFWALFHMPYTDNTLNFSIYCPSTDCTMLSNLAAQMNAHP